MRIVAILLAAGRGERFGGGKLLAPLPDSGAPVGVAALRSLRGALPDVIAVVRPDDEALAALLEGEGARVIRAERAHEGMGASLAAGVAAAADADGWLVALADMPWIAPATHARVAGGLRDGAQIVAPYYNNRRGHPVGFAAALRGELLALGGDEGARRVLQAHGDAVTRIDVGDAGVLRDVDRPGDL
ncbi:MAG: nucleotidyltransferase family protein [Betaproteobacteria bacterium]|jgi:molybdenum cofactor cytidylyltransferase|nr:nucleotidyltransferase family protein [Betaproteobacteria bacterium]